MCGVRSPFSAKGMCGIVLAFGAEVKMFGVMPPFSARGKNVWSYISI
jgi:hypothetical protein